LVRDHQQLQHGHGPIPFHPHRLSGLFRDDRSHQQLRQCLSHACGQDRGGAIPGLRHSIADLDPHQPVRVDDLHVYADEDLHSHGHREPHPDRRLRFGDLHPAPDQLLHADLDVQPVRLWHLQRDAQVLRRRLGGLLPERDADRPVRFLRRHGRGDARRVFQEQPDDARIHGLGIGPLQLDERVGGRHQGYGLLPSGYQLVPDLYLSQRLYAGGGQRRDRDPGPLRRGYELALVPLGVDRDLLQR